MKTIALAGLAVVVGALTLGAQAPVAKADQTFAKPAPGNMTLTAVEGVKVGHFTLSERPTGCTVVLF